jgi:type II secretory pathway component PulC
MEHLRHHGSEGLPHGGTTRGRAGTRVLLNVVLAVGVFLSLAASAADAGSPDDGDFERFRAIAEKNMFARRRAADPKPQTAPQVVNEPALPDIRLVGIVRMSDPYSSIAIIAAGGRHRLCRVGDSVEGLILRSIRDHDIVFETPSGHWLT